MPHNLADEESTFVQVMAWRHRTTSHYLKQFWPISMASYGVTRPCINPDAVIKFKDGVQPQSIKVILMLHGPLIVVRSKQFIDSRGK